MATTTDKSRMDFAEQIAKHADLSVNVVLRTFSALQDCGVDVMDPSFKRTKPPVKKSEPAAKVTSPTAGAQAKA